MTAPGGQFLISARTLAWDNLYPEPPVCFQVRGLVPKQATLHPDLTPEQMATQYHGLFTNELLPVSGVFFGTDASGGPRGADPRMRVVSWAVVAVRVTTHPVHSPSEGTYELLGTMTGPSKSVLPSMKVNRSRSTNSPSGRRCRSDPPLTARWPLKGASKPISTKLCLRFGPPP